MLETGFLSGGGSKGDGVNLVLDGKEKIITGKETSDIVEYLYCLSKQSFLLTSGNNVTISYDYEKNITAGSCAFKYHNTWQDIKTFDAGNSIGHEIIHFKVNSFSNDVGSENPAMAYFQGVFTGTLVLRNIKIEIGTVANPIWTPAPEDVVVRSELEDIFGSGVPNDLLEYANKGGATNIRFTFTNNNTENTPHKSNLTGSTAGEAFIIGSGNYQTILYVPSAGTDIFIRIKSNGNWGEWRKIESTIAVAADEPDDDLEMTSLSPKGGGPL